MASRALSRSIISSARSALHSSGRNTVSVRAASAGGGSTGSSATARPPSSSGTSRNYLFRNDSASSRRRLAESTIPLHNAVANAKLKSHLAINSSPCSAISLGNMGNLLIVVVPALCHERESPFGEPGICKLYGTAYVSLSMAVYKDFLAHIGAP